MERPRAPASGTRPVTDPTDAEERLRSLGALFGRLAGAETLQALLADVSVAMPHFAPCDVVVLALPADDSGALRVLRCEPPARSVAVGLEPSSEHPLGRVLAGGLPVIVADLDRPRLAWDGLARRQGIRCYAALPLSQRGTPVAAVLLGSALPNRYDAMTLLALEPLLSAIGGVIEGVATRERGLERSRRLEIAGVLRTRIGRARDVGEVADALADLLPEICPFDRLSLALVERDEIVLAAVRGRTAPEWSPGRFRRPRGAGSILDAALEAGRPLVIADQEVSRRADDLLMPGLGLRSFLFAPLRGLEDEPIGTLNLGSATPGAYGRAEVGAVEPIAAQVAGAVAHARLLDEVRSTARVVLALPDAVLTTDARLRVSFANDGCVGLLGRPRESIVGSDLSEALGEPLPAAALEAARKRGFQGDVRARGASGRPLLVAASLAALLGRDGRVSGFVFVGRDVSEQRRLERQSLQADQLAALGALAAGIGHEIRNPAGWLLTNLEILAADERGEERLRDSRSEVIDDCLDGVRRIRDIAADLRSFAAPSVEAPGQVDVKAVVQRAARMTRPELRRHATLHLDLAAVPPVTGHEGRLVQVVVNLLTNAAQAIPEGAPSRHVVRVATRSAGDQVVVEVEDDGAGIPADVADRVFEPFFTTKADRGGTGLGLGLCLDIVRQHGGTISLQPRAEGGTRVRVVLPVAR